MLAEYFHYHFFSLGISQPNIHFIVAYINLICTSQMQSKNHKNDDDEERKNKREKKVNQMNKEKNLFHFCFLKISETARSKKAYGTSYPCL